MDLIDILRARAAEQDRAIDTMLNGVPIRVLPSGEVTVRETIDEAVPSEEEDA